LIVGVDWLGDALFMTPVFRALRRRWPDAFLAVSTASRNLPVLARCSYLDEVIPYDEAPFLLSLHTQAGLSAKFRSLNFDTAVFLHRSFTRALAAALAGIPRRAGFKNFKRDWLLTELLDRPKESLHRIDQYLSILQNMGVPVVGREPELTLLEEDRAEWMRAAARSGWDLTGSDERRQYVALHPGGNWDLKRWPIERFADLARRASARGWRVAVCGSAHEAHLGQAIEAAAPGGRVVSFCGKTEFGGLAGLLAGARLVISNDSGPLHVAAALGTPAVGLFGPTLPQRTGPVTRSRVKMIHKDFGCELPCTFKACNNRVCLDYLSIDEAARAADEVLGEQLFT
jgi:lipopolysaccharide heptosyltransferase II